MNALDMQAHDVQRWNAITSPFRYPELYYQRILRLVEHALSMRGFTWRVIRFAARFRLQRVSVRTGISLPPGVAGPGLSIAHYGSIVVNSNARIGAFCRIHSATNIGVAASGVPTIGDFVYIGPGAVLYGGISVGNGAVIGANSVVNKDVPPGVTVAGAPARIIARRDSSTVVPQWFPNYGNEELTARGYRA